MAVDQTIFKYVLSISDVLESRDLEFLGRARPRLEMTEKIPLSFALVVSSGFIQSSEKVHCVRYGAMENRQDG